MKKYAFFSAIALMVCAQSFGAQPATTQLSEPEVKSFELTPVAPPMPAMKYSFQYPADQRITGNAAPIYLDAALLMPSNFDEKAEAAWDAYQKKDFQAFEKFAEELDKPAFSQQIEQAGRRTTCDYNPTLEKGVLCLLPHLNILVHGLERSIAVDSAWKIRHGKIDDALIALRRGYVMADDLDEPTIVSALVSAGCRRLMNDVLIELMSNQNAPNLYWAIRQLPSKKETLRHAMDYEANWIAFQSDNIRRYAAGETLTADEWRRIFRDLEVAFITIDKYDFKSAKMQPHPDPIKDASPETVKQARANYADSHKASPDQAAGVDPAIVLGEFYFHQYLVANDQEAKLRVLPYPEWLARVPQADADTMTLRKNNPTNPFLILVSTLHKAVWTFARTDRQTAALAAVEAIRAYTAANNGSLPQSLDDVKETPVPLNPVSGNAFEYRVENNVATLSDTHSESPLTYTIKIRH